MNKPHSLVSIDILRALAAAGVFYYHQHLGSVLAHYTGLHLFSYTDAFGAEYSVPLFFLISGYCIHLSNLKYLRDDQSLPLKEYFKRRFLRIYPPYLTALLFSIGVDYVTGSIGQLGKTDFLVHLFLFQGFTVSHFNTIDVVLWTISVEIAFYILYPIFYYLRRKYSLSQAMRFTFIVSSASITWFSLEGQGTSPEQFCVFNFWFAWCCGAFLADKVMFNRVDLSKPIFKVIYAIISLAFIFVKIFPIAVLTIIGYQLDTIIWTGPLVFIIGKEHWFADSRSLIIRMLAAIGLSSYSLYLFHDPLIMLKNYLAHEFLQGKLQLLGVSVGILIIPVLCWYSYVYIEKPFLVRKRKIAVNV